MKGADIIRNVLNIIRPNLRTGSINEEIANWLKANLDQIITFISSPLYNDSYISEFERLTINKKIFNGEERRISEIKHLKYPPSDIVKSFGRANYIRQSVFYGTFNSITAANEMRPNYGSIVTISRWKLKPGVNLKYTPIFKITAKNDIHNEMSLNFYDGYVRALEQYDDDTAAQIDELIQFMSECFAKEVDPNNSFDYFLSAYFANRLFSELDIDAIIYPSVREELTLSNIVLKPEAIDNKFLLEEVTEGRIERVDKGFFIEDSISSNKFTETEIIWN